MEALSAVFRISSRFSVAVTRRTDVLLLGVFVGTLVGVLPGIGPLAAIAMLLPRRSTSASRGTIMLAGIYTAHNTGRRPPTRESSGRIGSMSLSRRLCNGDARRPARLAIARIGPLSQGRQARCSLRLPSAIAEIALISAPRNIFSDTIGSYRLGGARAWFDGQAIGMIFVGLLFGIASLRQFLHVTLLVRVFGLTTDFRSWWLPWPFGFAKFKGNLESAQESRLAIYQDMSSIYPTGQT